MAAPSLTRQSSNRSRRKTRGLMRRAELNQPHRTWMSPTPHPPTHVFRICTVYVGIPLGSGAVAPWYSNMSSFEQTPSSPIRSSTFRDSAEESLSASGPAVAMSPVRHVFSGTLMYTHSMPIYYENETNVTWSRPLDLTVYKHLPSSIFRVYGRCRSYP